MPLMIAIRPLPIVLVPKFCMQKIERLIAWPRCHYHTDVKCETTGSYLISFAGERNFDFFNCFNVAIAYFKFPYFACACYPWLQHLIFVSIPE